MRVIKLKKNISLEFAALRKVCNEGTLLLLKSNLIRQAAGEFIIVTVTRMVPTSIPN